MVAEALMLQLFSVSRNPSNSAMLNRTNPTVQRVVCQVLGAELLRDFKSGTAQLKAPSVGDLSNYGWQLETRAT